MRYSNKNRRTQGLSKSVLGMAALLPGIALEALAGLTKKLGCQAQIHLCGPQTAVAQIDRQLVQEPLHVGTLLIPGGETVNGEGVAQVVNPRLLACVSPTNACAIAQNSEGLLQRPCIDRATQRRREKGGLGWPSLRSSAVVLDQGAAQLRSKGNQSRLAELRVPNGQDRPAQIHVGASQACRFPQPQANPIVHQNHPADIRYLQSTISLH